MSQVMDEKPTRDPGGRLALWLFYGFCLYSVWAMGRYFWVVGGTDPATSGAGASELNSATGIWLGALCGFMVLGGVCALLGALVWYTRPRRHHH
ncbi:hypothetical protein F9C28_07290 [Shimwellia pseudoproteus]|nr:hypothetical protein [Shimwellia pseudoproteus]